MNQVLSLLQASRSLAEPRSTTLHSDHMLAELLSLHGDMIEQLRLERLGNSGNSVFLNELIEQHEQAVVLLRLRIEARRAKAVPAKSSALMTQPEAMPHHYRALHFAAASLIAPQSGTTAPPHGNFSSQT